MQEKCHALLGNIGWIIVYESFDDWYYGKSIVMDRLMLAVMGCVRRLNLLFDRSAWCTWNESTVFLLHSDSVTNVPEAWYILMLI